MFPELRLLFDQNLPVQLVASLADIFPASSHVTRAGLAAAKDEAIWQFARDMGFAIVSKDADFNNLGWLHGAPPKIIWLRAGNASVREIEDFLRRHSVFRRFAEASEAVLALRR